MERSAIRTVAIHRNVQSASPSRTVSSSATTKRINRRYRGSHSVLHGRLTRAPQSIRLAEESERCDGVGVGGGGDGGGGLSHAPPPRINIRPPPFNTPGTNNVPFTNSLIPCTVAYSRVDFLPASLVFRVRTRVLYLTVGMTIDITSAGFNHCAAVSSKQIATF